MPAATDFKPPLCREAIKPWDAPSTVPTYLDAFGLLSVSKPVRVGKDVGRKSHVLVCAPSNSALDEIVMRLLSTGLLDEYAFSLQSPPAVLHFVPLFLAVLLLLFSGRVLFPLFVSCCCLIPHSFLLAPWRCC